MTYAGAIQYVYDNNGNVTEIHPVQEVDYYYMWDYENRLTKVKKSGSGGPDSLRFTYCALGNRIQKLHSTSDTTKYTFDGIYVVCRFGNNDSLLSKYIYANGMLLARVDSSDARYYYHHDGLGSTMGITDTLRAISKSYLYDDFGALWDSWGSISNTYQYTGQEYDDEIQGTELYNLRARYYDPEIGRFLSEDPINRGIAPNPQNHNPYPYTINNPVNYVDPQGTEICIPTKIEHLNQQPINETPGDWNFLGLYESHSIDFAGLLESHSYPPPAFPIPSLPQDLCVFGRYWYTRLRVRQCYTYLCYDKCGFYNKQECRERSIEIQSENMELFYFPIKIAPSLKKGYAAGMTGKLMCEKKFEEGYKDYSK
jgi:RHS repeat-associated protein